MKRLWVFACVLAAVSAGCRGNTVSVPLNPVLRGANANSSHTAPLIVVDPSKVGAVVSGRVLGANMAT